MQLRFGFRGLPMSLLQNTVTLSGLIWDVMNKRVPFAITPDPKTITKVTRYATTLSIFTVISRHFWFAMDPESTFIGGSLNTSHPLVSVTVLVLERKENCYYLIFFYAYFMIAAIVLEEFNSNLNFL